MITATPIKTQYRQAPGRLTIHSKIGFAVKPMGVATVRGEFREFGGTIEIGEASSPPRAYGTVKTAR